MIKRVMVMAIVLISGLCNAQDELYQKLSLLIKQNYPGLTVQNKVLVVGFLDPKVDKSMEGLKSLDKAGNVYETAKLKGGRSGALCVNVVNDSQSEIVFNKQGHKHVIVINASQLGTMDLNGINNMTFDSNGKIVYKNLEPEKIFEAINQLITR